MHFPLNHKWDQAVELSEKIRPLLLTPDVDTTFMAHHIATCVVPQTMESMWSGHFLPAIESLCEAEVSSNLELCGFHKQAMASLRSSLELGLLSVYWNISDDGHLIIRRWLRADEETPRPKEIWGRLCENDGIAGFAAATDLEGRIRALFSELSNYVHARGARYSNDYWGPVGMCYGLVSPERVREWVDAYREVVWIVLGLHVAKYPIATVRYDWSRKFGVDVPSFGGLSAHQVDQVEDFLGGHAFRTLTEIAEADSRTCELLEWIESKPDMSEQEMEDQIRRIDRFYIEGSGFEVWEVNERRLYGALEGGMPPAVEKRIADLRHWATANGHLESPASIKQHFPELSPPAEPAHG